MKLRYPIMFGLGVVYILLGFLLFDYVKLGQATRLGSIAWIVVGSIICVMSVFFPDGEK